jgi:hypothetical protein
MPESLGCEQFVTLNKAYVLTAEEASRRERVCVVCVYWFSVFALLFPHDFKTPWSGTIGWALKSDNWEDMGFK